MGKLQGPHFINVDLEVWSRKDLAALARVLKRKAFVLYAGKLRRKFLVSFETRSSRAHSPESTIRALLDTVGSLPPTALKAWKTADARVFNVGYQAGDLVTVVHERPLGSGRWYAKDRRRAAKPCETSFSPELLRAVARVEATITTTIYPPTKQVVPSRRTPAASSTRTRRP